MRTEPNRTESNNMMPLANFVRHLFHNLRSPVASIRMSAELLQGDLPQEARDELHGILVSASKQLEGILERSVYFVSLERPQPHPIRIQELLDLSLRRYQGTIQIDLDLSAEVKDRMIQGDQDQLVRLLDELITNAHEAGGDTIQLSGCLEADRFVLSVIDDGEGCSSQDVEQMFEPFVSTRDGQPGLGLAIARRIAVGHGGSISLRNRDSSSGSIAEIRLVLSQ